MARATAQYEPPPQPPRCETLDALLEQWYVLLQKANPLRIDPRHYSFLREGSERLLVIALKDDELCISNDCS